MTTNADKIAMLAQGEELSRRFCAFNGFFMPKVTRREPASWPFGRTCAYWRNEEGVQIVPEICAGRGVAGRAWSWPGYAVDRTPVGVVAHEIGHMVDWTRSTLKRNYYGDVGIRVRRVTGEPPLTTYADTNDAEWFAEAFRLFITNPDLLKLLMPRTHRELLRMELKPIVEKGWRVVLNDAPKRTIQAAENRIDAARSAQQKQESLL